eukprot:10308970-Alexandrium_andersonii.AAC.1
MSASLVGSEMCIRDRCGNAEQFPAPSASDWIISPKLRAELKRPELEAVSYTHLTLPTICSV